MTNRNEDQDVCRAFNELQNTIKALRMVEKNVKCQNNSALEKCKQEIEHLLKISKTGGDTL